VTTIYGTNGLTSDILDALMQHDVKRLLIAFDADAAGERATAKHVEAFMSLGIECFRVKMTMGMDVNSYAMTAAGGGGGNVHNWLSLLIRNAEWLGKGKPPTITTPTPDFLQQAREPIAADKTDAAPPKPQAANRKFRRTNCGESFRSKDLGLFSGSSAWVHLRGSLLKG